jgi:hypothetical protein
MNYIIWRNVEIFKKKTFLENEASGKKLENLSDLGQGYLFSTWNFQNQLIIQ